METTTPLQSVTFGRFNIPHPGHIDLIKRMLEVSNHAYVGVSSSSRNNDLQLRVEVLDQLCYRAGLPWYSVSFFACPNPFEAVKRVITEADDAAETIAVFGMDQAQLGEKLSRDFGVKFIPNEVRVGSSTVIRYFLEIGEEALVRDIYHNDEFIFADILDLRQEELLREKS